MRQTNRQQICVTLFAPLLMVSILDHRPGGLDFVVAGVSRVLFLNHLLVRGEGLEGGRIGLSLVLV